MSKIKNIVFMGTPDFAVASLDTLFQSNFKVVGVITAPDKPAGRGKKLQSSAVKKYALEKNLKVLQPTNLKDKSFQEELKALNADIFVVVAFRMLPESVWNMPPLGSVNLHGSLLPQYRGAAPINWAVINGEKETGVSTFFLQHEIDTGKIIFKDRTSISEDDTAGTIHDKLMEMGADLILKTIEAIDSGNYPQEEQDHITAIKHAPKIFKEDCRINWNQDRETIHNHIRGLSPFPTAWTTLEGLNVKIYLTAKNENKAKLKPGELFFEKEALWVGTKDKNLEILELQLAGKKRMPAKSFIQGFNQIENKTYRFE
jgi:methionyl-tRNA formyltransferase